MRVSHEPLSAIITADPAQFMTAQTDTIFALSSGRPPAAIAVIRVSGPRAGDAVLALAGRMPAPRQAMFARLRDRANAAEIIDEGLVLWFPGPAK